VSKGFQGLSNIIPKISNPFNLAAFALVVVGIVLVNVEGLESEQKTLVLCVFLVGVFVILGILKPSQLKAVTIKSESEGKHSFSGIEALIDSSSIPLYLTDQNLNVIYCNKQFAFLMDSNINAIINRHITDLLDHFALRVHEKIRDKFIVEQKELMLRSQKGTRSHADYTTIIDNRDLPGSPYSGTYRLWIHSDKIADGPDKKIIGAFVIFHLDELEEGSLQPAVDEILAG